MEVVEADGIQLLEKVAILKAWEADERALLRAEDEGMSGGEHAHLHKGWRLWSISRIWASRRSLQQNLTNFT
jgi:hypothetical protein